MTATYQHLFSEAFLRAVFDKEFQTFRGNHPSRASLNWSANGQHKSSSDVRAVYAGAGEPVEHKAEQ